MKRNLENEKKNAETFCHLWRGQGHAFASALRLVSCAPALEASRPFSVPSLTTLRYVVLSLYSLLSSRAVWPWVLSVPLLPWLALSFQLCWVTSYSAFKLHSDFPVWIKPLLTFPGRIKSFEVWIYSKSCNFG